MTVDSGDEPEVKKGSELKTIVDGDENADENRLLIEAEDKVGEVVGPTAAEKKDTELGEIPFSLLKLEITGMVELTVADERDPGLEGVPLPKSKLETTGTEEVILKVGKE